MIEELVGVVMAAYLIFFLGSILYLTYSVKKRTGVFPIVRNTDNMAYGFVGKIVLITYLLIIINVLFFIVKDFVFEIVTSLILDITGLVIIGLALICMVTSQLQMSESWRVGIDSKSKIKLIKKGFFKYLRHPIYFFAVVLGFGIILVITNFMTIFLSFLLWVILSIQSRLEEEFMLSKFGGNYKKFMQSRKRFF